MSRLAITFAPSAPAGGVLVGARDREVRDGLLRARDRMLCEYADAAANVRPGLALMIHLTERALARTGGLS